MNIRRSPIGYSLVTSRTGKSQGKLAHSLPFLELSVPVTKGTQEGEQLNRAFIQVKDLVAETHPFSLTFFFLLTFFVCV